MPKVKGHLDEGHSEWVMEGIYWVLCEGTSFGRPQKQNAKESKPLSSFGGGAAKKDTPNGQPGWIQVSKLPPWARLPRRQPGGPRCDREVEHPRFVCCLWCVFWSVCLRVCLQVPISWLVERETEDITIFGGLMLRHTQ